ncbi:MAG: dolichyl-phosphate beta-glucosyltransferase, partial [Acidobacteriota bacterium]
GEKLPLVPANHAFLAFEAPAGRSTVRLHYRPHGWDLGWLLSATAAALALVWVGFSRRRGMWPKRPSSVEASEAGEVEPGAPGAADVTASGAVELSVVIPAYNEEARLGSTLESCFAHLEGRSFELLVVDDGSSDRTVEVATAFEGVRVLRLKYNQGKGAALRCGVLASRGRRVLLMDADASIPIDQVERLAAAGVPVAIASRVAGGAEAEREQTPLRRLMGRGFNVLLRGVGAVQGIGDTQCGFKLFDGDVARDLFRRSVVRGFAFDVEILWLAGRLGHEVQEVGVRWRDYPGSRVRPWLDPARMVLEVARFRWHHRSFRRVDDGRRQSLANL